MKTIRTASVLALLLAGASSYAQTPAAPAPAKPKARPPAFPQRPPADPDSVERGKAVYGVHCTFCHGADARGGSGGPNLIRAQLVLNDQHGELIGPVIREGREGMPKFDLSATQITDIANFIHSFRVGGYDVSRMTPPTIVTGDPTAGEAYFGKTCSGCHSVTGNLKGIATRVEDAKRLQQHWLMPSNRDGQVSPVTVTVSVGSTKVSGRLVRIDDFLVSLVDEEGVSRSFRRDGETPKVELHDPLIGHRKLLATYTDKDIHDLTAYLVTIR